MPEEPLATAEPVMAAPFLGLLLDVDGPIASPVTRTIAIRSILDDLVTLVAAGVPVAFITGRSDAFIAERVVEPLRAAGLGEALATPGARMFGVFEKGATWATIGPDGLGEIAMDAGLLVPRSLAADLRALVEREFADSMFYDDTKRAMVSIEQRTDVSSEHYRIVQERFERAAFEIARSHGVGVRWGGEEFADAVGLVPFRIDTTIISSDIESVADKDDAAARALDYFASLGPLPRVWRSVGDSRSDYKMADHVHAQGLEVAHVDVRPSDGVLDKPYRVILEGDLQHDEAGAAFLRYWVTKLDL